MMAARLCSILLLAIAALAGFISAAERTSPPAAARIDFNREIRPLLSDRCFRCHGPDGAKRKAKLRLDVRDGVFRKIGDGWAIVKPRDPGKSELVRRISSDDVEEMMPPPDSNLSLSDAEKALLTRWVGEGADYRPHWSLAPVPAVAPPAPARRIRPRESDRRVRPGAARPGEPAAVATRGAGNPHPPAGVQPDRAAAGARGHRRISRRPITGRLCPRRGPVFELTGLRRAHGDGLARSRPLRGHLRIPERLRARYVGISRLGHLGVQSEPAVP